ncbi:MAG TPA: hypothetical protein VFE70_02450 [Candidatus Elarobacter sp.]|nr:hypothetical protein [Candidatus Elarobacter sp.]
MTDTDQLRLDPDLIGVMRFGVTSAVAHGASFVAPAHVVLGLLADPRIGPAIAPHIPRERVEQAAAQTRSKLQDTDTIAFLSRDGAHSLYLDADAFHVFLEGARRASDVYRTKHLVFALTAEAVKEQSLLALVGRDPQAVTSAVDALG